MNNNDKSISLDFDGTLLHFKSVQDYAKDLLTRGIDVHITTRRYEEGFKGNNDPWWLNHKEKNWLQVYELADRLDIKRDNLHFRNMKDKSIFFIKFSDFKWHLDDDSLEVDDINLYSPVPAILVTDKSWKDRCESLLIDNELLQ